MTRRSGMSMAEVLVALFLLALGTIAILTMFPLGMYHMGQALKDDRTAQAANQANSYMRNYWRTNMVELGGASEPCFTAFTDPNNSGGIPVALQKPSLLQLNATNNLSFDNDPSYPVCVDPMGCGSFWSTTNSASMQFWVADFPALAAPYRRCSLFQIASPPSLQPQRVCSLMDGFTFNADGSTPNLSVPGNANTVERELRYNWLWVLQRPRNGDRSTATMKVVVFDQRSYLYAPPGAEQSFTTLAPTFSGGTANVPGSTIVSFPAGTDLGTKKGKWIADITCLNFPVAGNPPSPWVRNFNFYRIVSITDTGTSIDVELQEPLRQDSLSAVDRLGNALPTLASQNQARTFVVMAGVSEVFEFPMLTN